ncbi:MAG: hypothetical protein IJX41_03345 [Bacteroidaceae bacterium]|nr:hypothetical protein [Bacteroidaceae bacterium]
MPAWELAHKAGRKQNKKNATAFLFLAKELPKGMGEQSEANPKQEKRDSVLVSCKGTPKGMDKRSEVNPDQTSGKLAYRLMEKEN